MGLSARKKGLYALGQFGTVLGAYGVGTFFASFYVNRGLSDAVSFPEYISQDYLFGLFTVTGLVIALSRLADAVSGLFVGYYSDRSGMKRGRRTGFMAVAALPVALFSVLVFFPPLERPASVNAVAVLTCMIVFYVFLALYAIPYLSLLSEFGTSARDRMKMSTYMACATAIATLLGDRLSWFSESISSAFGLSPVLAFRIALSVAAAVSFLCMLAPALFINERRYSSAVPVAGTFDESFGIVARDASFRPYLVADIMYRIGSAFAISGFSWYVTVLLALPRSFIGFFALFIFFSNLAFYVPVCQLANKIGKKKTLSIAFMLLIVFLTLSSFAGSFPVPSAIQGAVLSILIAIPLAVFTVVPNAIVADFAVAAEKKTGAQRAGMYFGVHSLVMKSGQLFATLLFPLVMSVGSMSRNGATRVGLRTTLVLSAVFSFVGFCALFGYREKEVAALLEKKD
jgi:glycoside/pentoside/hexuronide:cation symporter, GPH family